MIYTEGKPDSVLVNFLGISKKEINHLGGKIEICKCFENRRNCLGLIDEDPRSRQPPYLKKMNVISKSSKNDIKILHDRSKDNCFIVLCPRLEEWILKSAKDAKIDVKKYNLPDDADELHDRININLDKFGKLLNDLKNSERIKILKKILKTQDVKFNDL